MTIGALQAKQVDYTPATPSDWTVVPDRVDEALDELAATGEIFNVREVWISEEIGNDTTGDGTIGQPWLTIAKALTAVIPVSCIHCQAGGYTTTPPLTPIVVLPQNVQFEGTNSDFGSLSQVYSGFSTTGGGGRLKLVGLQISHASIPAFLWDDATGSHYMIECNEATGSGPITAPFLQATTNARRFSYMKRCDLSSSIAPWTVQLDDLPAGQSATLYVEDVQAFRGSVGAGWTVVMQSVMTDSSFQFTDPSANVIWQAPMQDTNQGGITIVSSQADLDTLIAGTTNQYVIAVGFVPVGIPTGAVAGDILVKQGVAGAIGFQRQMQYAPATIVAHAGIGGTLTIYEQSATGWIPLAGGTAQGTTYNDANQTPSQDTVNVQGALDATKANTSNLAITATLANSGPINNQKPTFLAILGTTLWYYEVGNGAPAICSYSIAAPGAPVFQTRVPTITWGYLNYNAVLAGTRWYVPVQDTGGVVTGGILVVDLSNGVGGAALLGSYKLPNNTAPKPYDLALDPTGTYAAVPSNVAAAANPNLYIVNVSNPAAMLLVAQFGTAAPNNRYTSVAWHPTQPYLYACSETNNLIEVWSVANVAAPVLVETISVYTTDTTASVLKLALSPDGNTLIVWRAGPGILSMWDTTSPAAPVVINDLPFGTVSLQPISFTPPTPFSGNGATFLMGSNNASTDPGEWRVVDFANRAAPRVSFQSQLPVASVVGMALQHPTQPYVYVSDHVVGQLLTYSIAEGPRKVATVQQRVSARTTTGVVAGTTDYMTLSDFVVAANANAGAVTEYLPDARMCPGVVLKVVKTDASANTVALKNSVAAQKIGTVAGSVGLTTTVQGAGWSVVSDGTQWWLV